MRLFFKTAVVFTLLAILAGTFFLYIVISDMPSVESLKEVELQSPLRVYSSDDKLIAEFGEKRRKPVKLDDVPILLVKAFVAAEDASFFSHSGVDWTAMLRASLEYLKTGKKKQGGSTITMQVARNFFLTPDKTFKRKFKELVLAIIIERELTKEQILELYLNKIFLGHRSYGVGAAAQVYYGKPIDNLSLSQIAMIAGLPKAPSRTNPLTNPELALKRRSYVLSRMLKLGFISEAQELEARSTGVTAEWHGHSAEVPAPHLAEMVREFMLENFDADVYEKGLKVKTTIKSNLQLHAVQSLRDGLFAYDRRHGYRGPEKKIADYGRQLLSKETDYLSILKSQKILGDLFPAIVVSIKEDFIIALVRKHGRVKISKGSLRWARRFESPDSRGPKPSNLGDVVSVGDLIRVRRTFVKIDNKPKLEEGWEFSQLPDVEGAIVSIDPKSGAIQALVGGFDFQKSKFNRSTQAMRQVGSNFKPFLYSAGIAKGLTAATVINDAPTVYKIGSGEEVWRPQNYGGKYYGPTRLRQALIRSQNMVSVRLLDQIGINYAVNYASRFGYQKKQLPKDLSLALGSGELTPLQVATGYAVFSNGGFLVTPHFISTVEDRYGLLLYSSEFPLVCTSCEGVNFDDDGEPTDLESLQMMEELPPKIQAPRIISRENAWLISSMMRDVISKGTGRKARQLGRTDLAGKTGTTNDQRDAWFSGFNSEAVTTVWVGFDKVSPLGRRETGARAALPIWINYMREALVASPDVFPEKPDGLVVVRIDSETGDLSSVSNPKSIFEMFRKSKVPTRVTNRYDSALKNEKKQDKVEPAFLF